MYNALNFAGIICLVLALIFLVITIAVFFGAHIRDVHAFLTGKTSERAVVAFRNQTTTHRRAAVYDAEAPAWNGSDNTRNREGEAQSASSGPREAPTTQVGRDDLPADAQTTSMDKGADGPTTTHLESRG